MSARLACPQLCVAGSQLDAAQHGGEVVAKTVACAIIPVQGTAKGPACSIIGWVISKNVGVLDKAYHALKGPDWWALVDLLGTGVCELIPASGTAGAAKAVLGSTQDLSEALTDGSLATTRGIGPATLAILRELADTGKATVLEQLRDEVPPGLIEMLGVSGLGVTRIRALHEKLGIESLAELETAARDGRLSTLPGFGPKTAQTVLRGIAGLRRAQAFRLSHHAADEAAILRELERFLLELGTDFAFVARQKRITVGNEDFYLDLLFYHRRLARLIAIDLKLGRFQAAYKGQMELYLRWLDQHERRTEHEESPLGLILCSSKDKEQIELLQLNRGEIRVAEYLTALPEKKLLAAKLHDAVVRGREQLARHQVVPEESENEQGVKSH